MDIIINNTEIPHKKRYMTIFALTLLTVSIIILLLQLFKLSWDDIDLWLKIGSGILAGLLFFLGIGAIISGFYLNKRQEEKNAMLEHSNKELQLRIEQEKLTRLQLEESLEPRTLAHNGVAREKLKAFSGTPYIIEAVSDGEVLRVAGQIRYLLSLAQWSEIGTIQTNSEPDGVRIETIFLNENPENRQATSAALLVEFLEANGWEARNGSAVSSSRLPFTEARNVENIPNGTVRIRIGIKPTPYFMEKLTSGIINEQTQKNLDKSISETKARRDRLREEWNLPRRSP